MTRPDPSHTPHENARERDPEAPVADAAEQSVSVNPNDEESTDVRLGLEVGEWDAVEQSIVVDIDDDYDR